MSRAAWLAVILAACGPASVGGPTAPAGQATGAASAVPKGVPARALAVGRHGRSAAYLNADVAWVPSSRDDRFTAHRGGSRVTLGSLPPVSYYNVVLPLEDGKTAIAANYDWMERVDLRTGRKQWRRKLEGYPKLDVSPDGQHFVVSKDGRGLFLHSTKHGRMLAELVLDKEHREGTVAFSPTGKRLAYPDYQAGEIVVVDVATRKELVRLGGVGAARTLAFSPDGRQVAALHYSTLRVWDLKSRRTVFVDHQDGWNHFAFSPQGDVLWVGGKKGVIERVVPRYGASREQLILPGEPDVYALTMLPAADQDVAFVRDARPYLSLVDLRSGKELARLETTHHHIALSHDGRTLVASDGSATAVWTVPPADQLPAKLPVPWRREPGHLDSVEAIAVGGGRVVTGCGGGTVILWDGATGKPLKRRFGHARQISAVAIAPQAGPMPQAVAFAGEDNGGVWIYDRNLDELLAHIALGEADEVHIAFDPTGRRLLASRIGDGTDRTEVIDLMTKQVERTFKRVQWESFGFTSDGRFMLAGPAPAQLVDLHRGLRLREALNLPHGDYGDSTLTIADDRYLVAAAVKNERSYLWMLGTERRRDDQVSLPMAFSPGGDYFATTGEEGAPLVLATVDGSVVKELSPAPKVRRPDGERERPWAQSIAISPDLSLLAAGYDTGVARVWRVNLAQRPVGGATVLGAPTSKHLLADVRSAKNAVDAAEIDVPVVDKPLRQQRASRPRRLLVSPDGKLLAAWSSWGGARVLDIGTGKERLRLYGDGRDRIRNLSFGPGDRLALARDNGRGELRSLTDSTVIGEAKRGCRAAFEATGDAVACIGSDTQLWRDGKRVGRELKYAYPDVALMTSDGKLIVYDSYGDIRLVSVGRDGLQEAGQISDHLGSVDGLSLSADGRLLASLGSNVALVHELSPSRLSRTAPAGRLRHILEGHDGVSAVAITADGRRVATAAGREAWIWDLSKGTVVARIEASVGIAEALAFAPDGTLIAAGGRGTLTWWQLP